MDHTRKYEWMLVLSYFHRMFSAKLWGPLSVCPLGSILQTNGQAEIASQELEAALRCIMATNPSSLSSQLTWIEFAHNSLSLLLPLVSFLFKSSLGYQPPVFSAQEEEIVVQNHLCHCYKVLCGTTSDFGPEQMFC